MIQFWPPDKKRNYKGRGYQELMDPITNIFERFEDVDEKPSSTYVSKAEAKFRAKKSKIIENMTK